jgi:hypothetical protein
LENHLAPYIKSCAMEESIWVITKHASLQHWLEKILVHNNGEWFHGKFCCLVSHFEQWNKHVKEKIKKEHVGQKRKQKHSTFGQNIQKKSFQKIIFIKLMIKKWQWFFKDIVIFAGCSHTNMYQK